MHKPPPLNNPIATSGRPRPPRSPHRLRRIVSEDEEGEAGWPHIFRSGSLVELVLDMEIRFLQAEWMSVQNSDRGPPCRLRSSQWGSAHSADYRFTSMVVRLWGIAPRTASRCGLDTVCRATTDHGLCRGLMGLMLKGENLIRRLAAAESRLLSDVKFGICCLRQSFDSGSIQSETVL
jgi:hypothetical protein